MMKKACVVFFIAILVLTLCSGASAATNSSGSNSIRQAKVTFDKEALVYTGEPIEPAMEITLNGRTLVRDVDYEAVFSKNTNAGEATVTLTGLGEVTGTSSRTFTIRRAENVLTVEDLVLPMREEQQTATLAVAQTGDAKLVFESDRKSIRIKNDGTITVSGGYVGIAKVTIVAPATKNYKRASVQVMVASLEVPTRVAARGQSGGRVRMRWDVCEKAEGYELRLTDSEGQEMRFDGVTGNETLLGGLWEDEQYILSVRGVYARGEKKMTSPWSETIAFEIPRQVLFFGSDFQPGNKNQDPWEIVPDICDTLDNAGYMPDQVVMCGDYLLGGGGFTGPVEDSLSDIASDLEAYFPGFMPGEDFFAVQGNHDKDEGEFPENGLHDLGDVLLYIMHTETANPYKQGKTGESAYAVLKTGIGALSQCLTELTEAGERRPVFIATHVPLHFSKWTTTTGDNLWNAQLFDVINDYGNELTIIYLFGHTHGYHGDSSIGGTCVGLLPGDRLLVPDPRPEDTEATTHFSEETLTFTYMTAGYVGYTGGGGEDRRSMGVAEVYHDRVELLRFGQETQVPFSAQGVRTFELLPEDYLSVERLTATIPLKSEE